MAGASGRARVVANPSPIIAAPIAKWSQLSAVLNGTKFAPPF